MGSEVDDAEPLGAAGVEETDPAWVKPQSSIRARWGGLFIHQSTFAWTELPGGPRAKYMISPVRDTGA